MEEGKIKIILDKMRIAIETGKIPIESKKHQKLLDILRSMSLFESLRHRYKETKNHLEEMTNDMPSIEGDIQRLKSEIESEERAVAKLRKELENNNARKNAAMQKIEELKDELASAVSEILGKKVTIVNW